jgi:hypothetical protein
MKKGEKHELIIEKKRIELILDLIYTRDFNYIKNIVLLEREA